MARMNHAMLLAAGAVAIAGLSACSGRLPTAAQGTPPVASEGQGSAEAMAALTSGRFAEAAALHAAALEADPQNRQAQLGYALAQLGLGHTEQAVARLQALAADAAPDPDVGLALALAGRPQEGILLLEAAAQRPGADRRVRQNLALALALADSWPRARALAAQDAGEAWVTRQMTRWAVWAALPPQDRLAGFLGVVPVRAAAVPARAEPPLYAAARAEPVATAEAPELPETPDTPQSVVAQSPEPAARAALADASAEPEAKAEPAGWVVQLAAVRHAENLVVGWNSLQARYPGLFSRYTPHTTQGQGWIRLSVGSFRSRQEAMAECQQLRRRGVDCFARRAEV